MVVYLMARRPKAIERKKEISPSNKTKKHWSHRGAPRVCASSLLRLKSPGDGWGASKEVVAPCLLSLDRIIRV